MKIAVFGRTGQVATELRRRAPANVSVQTVDRSIADFSKPEMVSEAASRLDVDAIVNAVAYTNVDKAESEPDIAELVNAHSVDALANACLQKNIPLVHISTDYVFPGDGIEPWNIDDATGPLGVYGASKLQGEHMIQKAGTSCAILRTSWVFSAHGRNFVKTMLRLGRTRDRLSIVADQIGGPTPAADIADTCLTLASEMIGGHKGGTYHFSGAPDVSWADFAREIFAQSGVSCNVADISTLDFPTPAQRPLNSRLNCSTLETDFGISRPDWRRGLAAVLKEINA